MGQVEDPFNKELHEYTKRLEAALKKEAAEKAAKAAEAARKKK